MGHKLHSAHLTSTALWRKMIGGRRWTGGVNRPLVTSGGHSGLKREEAERGRDPSGVVSSHRSPQKEPLWTGLKRKECLCLVSVSASLSKSVSVRRTLFDFNLWGNVWNCRRRQQGPREAPLPKLFPPSALTFWEWSWFRLSDVNLCTAFIHRSVLCLTVPSLLIGLFIERRKQSTKDNAKKSNSLIILFI